MTLNEAGIECKVADPCQRCEHGMPHRAFVTEYDPAVGDYVKPDRRTCMARWAERGDGHAGDDICGQEAGDRIVDIDVCGYHAERLRQWGVWERPAEDNETARRKLAASERDLRNEIRADEKRRAKIREEERERANAAYSVVYFLRRTSDHAVKIGTSRDFEDRLRTLRGQHGELQILLTLAGSHDLEGEMHAKFDLYRTPRTEWFAPVWVLMNWILDQRYDRRYSGAQLEDVLSVRELRKLARCAPDEKRLRWRAGRVVWPQPVAADPAA